VLAAGDQPLLGDDLRHGVLADPPARLAQVGGTPRGAVAAAVCGATERARHLAVSGDLSMAMWNREAAQLLGFRLLAVRRPGSEAASEAGIAPGRRCRNRDLGGMKKGRPSSDPSGVHITPWTDLVA